MTHYRLYLLDDCGRIINAVDAYYRDDDEALAAVEGALSAGVTVEIWCGIRRVGRVSGALLRAGD